MTEPSTAGSGKDDAIPPPSSSAPEAPVLRSIWARLKKHKVMQWTLAYAAAAYTLLHGVEMVSHYFEWPLLIGRLVTVTLALGVPIAIILAWYHGHKAKHRISGPELTMITVLLLIAGSVLWVVARTNEAKPLVPAAATTAPTTPIATASGAPSPSAPRTSIAVMPFVNLTGDATKDYLGDGMAEEVINTLTRVPGLKGPSTDFHLCIQRPEYGYSADRQGSRRWYCP